MVLRRNAPLAKVSIDSLCLAQRAAVSICRFFSSQNARCQPAHSPVRSFPSQTTHSPLDDFLHSALRTRVPRLAVTAAQEEFGFRPGAASRQRRNSLPALHLPMLLAQRCAAPEAARGSREAASALPSLPGAADWRTGLFNLRPYCWVTDEVRWLLPRRVHR